MAKYGSWQATQQALESQGGGTFLRLQGDGDAAVVAFCGGPQPREIFFNEKTQQYEPWTEAAAAAGEKRQTKYLINAYVFSAMGTPVNEMKVLDLNAKTVVTVMALRDKYGFGKYPFEIKRDGAKGDTRTQYHVLPENRELSAEERALVGHADPKDPTEWIPGSVPMHDLDELVKRGDEAPATGVTDDLKRGGPAQGKSNGARAPAAPTGGAALVARAVKDAIIEKLRPLDRDKGVDKLLAAFPYAKKVSDLRASDEAAALAIVAKLTAPTAAPTAPAASEDPFG